MLDLVAASDSQPADVAEDAEDVDTPLARHVDDPAMTLVNALVPAESGAKAKDEDVTPVRRAAAEVRRRIKAGETPVGLNRLSEVVAPIAAVAPAPRQPIEDPDAVVEVVRRYPCAVVDAADALSIARCLAAVLADGRRVVVTGTDPVALAEVRAGLPEPLHGLCLDRELPLTESQVRELRWLMVTETMQRRERFDQLLPERELVPSPQRVAQLCRASGKGRSEVREGAELIPELLGKLDDQRLAALIDTARRCLDALDQAGLNADSTMGRRDAAWTRPLLEQVMFGTARPAFEKLLRGAADLVASAGKLSTAADRMGVIGELPADAISKLRAYADFLDAGGKPRLYFRSEQQRGVEPVLAHLQLDGEPVKDSALLRQAIAFLRLIESMELLRLGCKRLGVPQPSDVPAVAELKRRLDTLSEAALATEDLRHEVLFIHPTSPVSMPDLATTQQVAAVIAESGGVDEVRLARAELDSVTEELTNWVAQVRAPHRPAPEACAAADALREMDVATYSQAVAELSAARRQHADQSRLGSLLDRLRAGAPGLAQAWQQAGAPSVGCGTARFIPLNGLLGKLPAPDTADLVLLLGADTLNTENLLVAAAAPRLLAVGNGFTKAPLPAVTPGLAGLAGESETVLTALRRAGVPVIAAAEPTGAHAASGAHAITGTTGVRDHVDAQPDTASTEATPSSQPEPTPPATTPTEKGAAMVAEEEAAFMVLPLGIVPRQQDRASAEFADNAHSNPAHVGESDQSG